LWYFPSFYFPFLSFLLSLSPPSEKKKNKKERERKEKTTSFYAETSGGMKWL